MYEKAVEHLEEAIRIRPEEIMPRSLLAQTYWHMGEIDQALATVRAAIKIDPKASDLRGIEGGLLAENEQYDESFDVLRRGNPDGP